jgi:hypothetical protein
LLRGLVFSRDEKPMVIGATTLRGRKYRYYVTPKAEPNFDLSRVPTNVLDDLVQRRASLRVVTHPSSPLLG